MTLGTMSETRGIHNRHRRRWLIGILALPLALLFMAWKGPHLWYWYRILSNPEEVIALSRVPASEPVSDHIDMVPLGWRTGVLMIPRHPSLKSPPREYGWTKRCYEDGCVGVKEIELSPTRLPNQRHAGLVDDLGGFDEHVAFFRKCAQSFSFSMTLDDLQHHSEFQVLKKFLLVPCDEVSIFETNHAKGWIYRRRGHPLQIVEAYSLDDQRAVTISLQAQRFDDRIMLARVIHSIRFHE